MFKLYEDLENGTDDQLVLDAAKLLRDVQDASLAGDPQTGRLRRLSAEANTGLLELTTHLTVRLANVPWFDFQHGQYSLYDGKMIMWKDGGRFEVILWAQLPAQEPVGRCPCSRAWAATR